MSSDFKPYPVCQTISQQLHSTPRGGPFPHSHPLEPKPYVIALLLLSSISQPRLYGYIDAMLSRLDHNTFKFELIHLRIYVNIHKTWLNVILSVTFFSFYVGPSSAAAAIRSLHIFRIFITFITIIISIQWSGVTLLLGVTKMEGCGRGGWYRGRAICPLWFPCFRALSNNMKRL